jgi:hypothetical protein
MPPPNKVTGTLSGLPISKAFKMISRGVIASSFSF